MASFLGFGALLVLFGANSTELIERLDLDYADLGLLGSMLSLGLGVGIVGAGPICDRLPRRPLFVAACLIVVGATQTLGPDTHYPALLIHTLAIGFGAGFYETVLNALVVEEFGERAPRRLIFIHSAATLAASLTPLAFEFARDFTPLAWYDTFRIVGVLHVGLIAAGAFVPMRPSPRSRLAQAGRSPAGDPRAPAREVSAGPDRDGPSGHSAAAPTPVEGIPAQDDRIALAAICIAAFAYVGVESALTLFVSDHATSDLGLPASRAAQTISAFWGGLLVGRLAIGLSPRPIGAGTTAALASLGALVTLLFGFGWIGTPELAMAVTGFCLGGVFPIMIGLAGMALPSSAGTAVGLAGGLGALGGFTIPWFTGRIASQDPSAGLSVALASLSGWLLLLVAAALFARRRRHGAD